MCSQNDVFPIFGLAVNKMEINPGILVVLEYPMLHIKFRGTGQLVLEKKLFKFYHIWAWQPCWSGEKDRLKNLLLPDPEGDI